MKKGFTLVELLAVIIILGAIFAITFSLVTDNIRKTEEKAFNLQKEQIIAAAKDMVIKEYVVIPDKQSITLYVGELKRKGLLPIKMINAKTKLTISNESNVVISRENNSYSYDVNIIDLEEESTENNENAPVIRLNGNYVEYVEINTEYVEKGGTAYSNTGSSLILNSPQIKSNDNEGGEIDTSKLGTYKLIYSVTDKGLTTTSIRTVVVRDTIPPVIYFPENNIVKVSELNGAYVKKGVYAIDNSNEGIKVTYVSSLSNVPGKHVILYTAKDPSGNTTNAKRVITVVND
jgi:prepilin-type N-terminal cleavage/methylation domain-containing protein